MSKEINTTYTIHLACDNCNHAWDQEVPLRNRVAYSWLEHAMVIKDQATGEAQIVMCPNCHCLEDVRKVDPQQEDNEDFGEE